MGCISNEYQAIGSPVRQKRSCPCRVYGTHVGLVENFLDTRVLPAAVTTFELSAHVLRVDLGFLRNVFSLARTPPHRFFISTGTVSKKSICAKGEDHRFVLLD